MGETQERPESCVTRAIYGGISGFGFGAILGAVSANWSDVPKVIRNKSWPAFAETGKYTLFIVADQSVDSLSHTD